MLGEVRIEQRADGTYANLEMEPAAILLAAGSQLGLVAGARFVFQRRRQSEFEFVDCPVVGAGFEPATFGL